MKITCAQKDLAKGIAVANRAVAPRSTLPILGNIMLSAEGDELRIVGTNLQMRISCVIACQVKDAGSITIPARLFGDIISKLLSGNVTLDVNHNTKSINVTSGNYKAKINGLDSFDYPATPDDDELMSVLVNANILRQMIDQVAFAATSDEGRITLTGVELSFSRYMVSMAATDSFRLAVRSVRLDTPIDNDCTVIVPSSTLTELSNALSAVNGGEAVSVKVYRNHRISFAVDGGESVTSMQLSSQLINAKFPDYRAIIPHSHKTTATVDTKALVRSLQIARILLKGDLDRVDLSLSPGSLGVSIVNAEVGESGDELPATVEGETVTATLSSGFLLDVLSRIDEPSVVIALNGSRMPSLIRPEGMDADQFTHVIMPISKGK